MTLTPLLLNRFAVIIFLLGSITAVSQPVEELLPVSSRPQTYTPAKVKKKVTASVQLPFFDDFSYDQHFPDTALWEDAYVHVNQTYGQSPPSLGVATFDGLNKDGLAYDLGSIATDSCDILTSRPIDLRGALDSVYLSFFWQAGGLGEKPESVDSLNLKFYDPSTKDWSRVWGVSGTDSNDFEQAFVYVNDAYHQDGFKFRFNSFGAPAGAFDTWNIDYVRLNDERNWDDTAFTDPAFTRPHPSLLRSFESVPWFHYNTIAQFDRKQNLDLFYQRNVVPGQPLNLNLCVYQISSGGNILANNATGDGTIDNSHTNFVETAYNCALGNFALPAAPTGDFEITALQTYTGTSVQSKGPNDTILIRQEFRNYYALDDGSAERAYQVRDNRGGFIITKYDVAEPDDIVGLYIYFMPSQYDIEDKQFSIVVYSNSNGMPGNLIYESDSLYTPRYTSSNFLLPYVLDKAVAVTGPVFIGIRQVSNVRLPIGFDVNTPTRGTKFYGTMATLSQSFVQGNLMIRPYLRYQPADLQAPEISVPQLKAGIYPNPARDMINIEKENANRELRYYLSNISGQVVQSGVAKTSINFKGTINSGVYLLRLEDPAGNKAPLIRKIVVKR